MGWNTTPMDGEYYGVWGWAGEAHNFVREILSHSIVVALIQIYQHIQEHSPSTIILPQHPKQHILRIFSI